MSKKKKQNKNNQKSNDYLDELRYKFDAERVVENDDDMKFHNINIKDKNKDFEM